ncbi:MAG: AAA family ATPase [Myxococcota bacterium]
MLDAITIRGFRSIASVEDLKLLPINVLIGANGSGKSNFLGVFAFLKEIREGRLQDYVARQGGADRILYFGAKVTPQVEFRLSTGASGYWLSLAVTAEDRLYPANERVSYDARPAFSEPREHTLKPRGGMEAGISDSASAAIFAKTRWRLSQWTTYHFHDISSSAPLRKTAHLNDNRFLRPDGSNLPAFLYLMRERHSSSYKAIRRAVHRIIPFFDDFVLEPLALRSDSIRLEWRHQGSDKHFDVSSLSDGSVRFIALATLLLQPVDLRPPIILIDEPELGLHPAAIAMLGSLVRMAAEGSQVILSTQSSLLLDQFEPEDVIVAEREEMATQLRRLDPERLEAWLEDYSLGELWEKNELGGRP